MAAQIASVFPIRGILRETAGNVEVLITVSIQSVPG